MNQAQIDGCLRAAGCKPRPAMRRWFLADRVSASRAQPGAQVIAKLGSAPVEDSMGRKAHVRGVYIDVAANVTIAAAADAVTGYQYRSLVESMFLQGADGHNFIGAIDARTILDDQFFRFGRMLNLPAIWTGDDPTQMTEPFRPAVGTTTDMGTAANANVTANVNIGVYFPLVDLRPNAPDPLAGLIPLASLQLAQSGGLRFRLASAVAGAPTGVTVNEYRRSIIDGTGVEGCDVYLDLVYLDATVIDSPWMLDEYTLPDLKSHLSRPEMATDYAWLRHFPEDDTGFAGQILANSYDGITVNVGGMLEYEGVATTDLAMLAQLYSSSRYDGAIARRNGSALLPENESGLNGFPLVPFYGARDSAPAGKVNYTFQTRPAAVAFSRFVHRQHGCVNGPQVAALQSKLGCDPMGAKQAMRAGRPCSMGMAGAGQVVIPNR